jgi:hypothetical protein
MAWRHGWGGGYGPGYGPDPYYGAPPVPAPPSKEEELAMLREQASYMESALGEIKKRMDELSKKDKTDKSE